MTEIDNKFAVHKPRLEHIKLDNIDKGVRSREDYKDMETLCRSIETHGLILPIAVQAVEVGYLLLAGGRRYRAHEMLGRDTIPCRVYDHEITELELRSIELEENIQREDLDWREKVNLQREIHRLQVAIYGEKTSTKPDAPGHSMQDTADMLNVSKGTVSKDIKLADAMEMFPDAPWQKCKNQSEATKLQKKLEDTFVRQDLAQKATQALGKGDDFLKKIMNSYVVGDFFEKVKEIPDGSINLVEIDPPYGIDLQKVKAQREGGMAEGLDEYNEVVDTEYPEFMMKTFKECYRVMKENSWLICWFGPEPWFELMYNMLIKSGFKTHRMCGIWVKPTGQTNSPTTRLGNAYEMFFYAYKGKATLSKPGRSNVFQYNPVNPDNKRHPTERPIGLMRDLLSTFAKENSRVLVPFAGSGSTLLAAAAEKMIPVGFDLSQGYKDRFVLHLQQAQVKAEENAGT